MGQDQSREIDQGALTNKDIRTGETGQVHESKKGGQRNQARHLHQLLEIWSPTKKLVFTAILAAFAAILQSAGGFLPGLGFLISPLATLPVFLGTLVALRYGVFTYLLTIFLLVLINPSELFIFPFTTGLLGLGLGWGLGVLKQGQGVLVLNAVLLSIGISIPLYILHFPILGPGISLTPRIKDLSVILGLAFFYSWLWQALAIIFLQKLRGFFRFM